MVFCIRCASLIDEELAKSSNFTRYAGLGILFLQFKSMLISKSDLDIPHVLYFKVPSFAFWCVFMDFMKLLWEKYNFEAAHQCLQYVFCHLQMLQLNFSLCGTFRNINIFDMTSVVPKLVE